MNKEKQSKIETRERGLMEGGAIIKTSDRENKDRLRAVEGQ